MVGVPPLQRLQLPLLRHLLLRRRRRCRLRRSCNRPVNHRSRIACRFWVYATGRLPRVHLRGHGSILRSVRWTGERGRFHDRPRSGWPKPVRQYPALKPPSSGFGQIVGSS